jgi:transcriptional repressor NrdR
VTDADLAGLAQQVEESIRATGVSQIDANEIGLAILPPLKTLDEVAYLRFASVYQGFESLDDFDRAVTDLRRERGASAAPSSTRDGSE